MEKRGQKGREIKLLRRRRRRLLQRVGRGSHYPLRAKLAPGEEASAAASRGGEGRGEEGRGLGLPTASSASLHGAPPPFLPFQALGAKGKRAGGNRGGGEWDSQARFHH